MPSDCQDVEVEHGTIRLGATSQGSPVESRYLTSAIYARFEMMRAVGAKAVASVEMAVPPTMVAGELSVETSEGETSGEDFCDGDDSDIDD